MHLYGLDMFTFYWFGPAVFFVSIFFKLKWHIFGMLRKFYMKNIGCVDRRGLTRFKPKWPYHIKLVRFGSTHISERIFLLVSNPQTQNEKMGQCLYGFIFYSINMVELIVSFLASRHY